MHKFLDYKVFTPIPEDEKLEIVGNPEQWIWRVDNKMKPGIDRPVTFVIQKNRKIVKHSWRHDWAWWGDDMTIIAWTTIYEDGLDKVVN